MAIVYRTQYTLGDRKYVLYLAESYVSHEKNLYRRAVEQLWIFRVNHSSLIGINLGSDYPTHQPVGREFYFPRI